MAAERNFSDIFHSKNDAMIEATLRGLPTDALLDIAQQAGENIQQNKDAARMSWLERAGVSLGVAVGLTALAYPIARWQGWTQPGFFKFITHPAALTLAGFSVVVNQITSRLDVEETNSVLISKIVDQELVARANSPMQLQVVRVHHGMRDESPKSFGAQEKTSGDSYAEQVVVEKQMAAETVRAV